MADENAKSQLDLVADTLVQLKEMHHYAKNNVERLTAIWMLFDWRAVEAEANRHDR